MAAPTSRDETPRELPRVPSIPNIPQGKLNDPANRAILQALALRAQNAGAPAASETPQGLSLGGAQVDTLFLLNRANHIGLQLAATIADFREVVLAIIAEGGGGSGQPLDPALTALSNLGDTVGVLEYLGSDAFAIRLLGAGAGTSVLTRDAGDARYSPIEHSHGSYFPTGW